jgi:hypothetical protein
MTKTDPPQVVLQPEMLCISNVPRAMDSVHNSIINIYVLETVKYETPNFVIASFEIFYY